MSEVKEIVTAKVGEYKLNDKATTILSLVDEYLADQELDCEDIGSVKSLVETLLIHDSQSGYLDDIQP